MYYFDILDILKRNKKQLSANDIFIKINKKTGRANLYRIRKILLNMALNTEGIRREKRVIKIKPYNAEYVYFYKI